MRQLGTGGLIETHFSGMWAALLGCILREAHCNNSTKKTQEGMERGKGRSGVEGEGYRIALP